MSAEIEQTYCVDTSALIEFRDIYPPGNFPGAWRALADLIKDGRFFAPRAVAVELDRGSDDLKQWVNRHKGMFRPDSQALIDMVSEVLRPFPDLVDEFREKEHADPWVVALAVLNDGILSLLVQRRCAVLQAEHRRVGRSRIPHVCQRQGIDCIDWREVFRREKWKFDLRP